MISTIPRGNNDDNQSNLLTGAIPSSLGSLTSLTYLDLDVRTLSCIITYDCYMSFSFVDSGLSLSRLLACSLLDNMKHDVETNYDWFVC